MSEKRTLTVIASAVALAIHDADAQCIPLNLHKVVQDLSEFATVAAEQAPAVDQSAVIAELEAEVDALKAHLIAAGIAPAPAPAPVEPPAAPADAPAEPVAS